MPQQTARHRPVAPCRVLTAALVAVLQLPACSTPAVIQRYDFGLPAPAVPEDTAAVPATMDIDVTAPAWLDTPAVVYRLAYADADQVHVYAQTQWVAPPARLVEQLLEQGMARVPACGPGLAHDPAAPRTRLQVELQEFSQVFPTPQTSTVALRARARLLAVPSRAVLAQRDFDRRTAASTADALGAVHGLRDLSASFADDALSWAAGAAAAACTPIAADGRPPQRP